MIVDPCDVCEESISIPSLPHGTLLATYGYTSYSTSYILLVDPASLYDINTVPSMHAIRAKPSTSSDRRL